MNIFKILMRSRTETRYVNRYTLRLLQRSLSIVNRPCANMFSYCVIFKQYSNNCHGKVSSTELNAIMLQNTNICINQNIKVIYSQSDRRCIPDVKMIISTADRFSYNLHQIVFYIFHATSQILLSTLWMSSHVRSWDKFVTSVYFVGYRNVSILGNAIPRLAFCRVWYYDDTYV